MLLLRTKLVFLLPLISILFISKAQSQSGSISGKISDAADGSELFGVTVTVKGTRYGAVSDVSGNYEIEMPAGNYVLEVTYIGYEKKVFTGITLTAAEKKILNITLATTVLTIDEDIVIIGEKPLVDVDDSKSSSRLSSETIEAAPTRNLQGILNTQTGVVLNPEGIHIRGGRTYETGFYIDDVSAQDPLAGTGFGLELGTNAIENIEVSTSSSSAEYGDATSGIVNTKTKSGGEKFAAGMLVKQDNFGLNKDWNSVFNQTIWEASAGGPLKFKSSPEAKFRYYTSFKFNFSDTYIQMPANQLVSSIYPDSIWSPRQDNRWSGMLKLNYNLSTTKKLSFTYLKSITINQDFNMLRITGNDVSFTPGYQWPFALQPDLANTYTHDTNLETIQWLHTPKPSLSYRVTASRLFVHLRADANGLPWRPEEVNAEFDPQSIVEFPATAFNPEDSVVFVNPAPGLYNNGGLATLWHDHIVEEYTLKTSLSLYSKNTANRFSAGAEYKHQVMQWIDIIRPWIGAPILLPDGNSTQSFRLGDISDIWKVQPGKGAFFITDKYKFRGLVADAGLRFEYWFPGAYVDAAIENSSAIIAAEIRENYLNNTVSFWGRRMKIKLLPKLAASFPITENQVMFFNYGHSTVMPHPTYLYAGLDPFYADRSTLGRIGNPDLNPEVDIAYEVGLRSQIRNNDALAVSAYWKDKYDFITPTSILLKDVTGREVSRTIYINSDYARVRGVELSYLKRAGNWFLASVSGSYSIATGQSSSSSEALQEIITDGNRQTSTETPLAWDSPLDAKGYALFTHEKKTGMPGTSLLNQFSMYAECIYRTGRRYTPYEYVGDETFTGRPIYEVVSDPEKKYSALGESSFWINLNFRKWIDWKETRWMFTVELNNLLNTKNSALLNPVTGRAYEYGDDVPTEWRDPRYNDPRDPRSSNIPPDNPARYYEQRHILFGLSFQIQ